jgi:hypothetical protein
MKKPMNHFRSVCFPPNDGHFPHPAEITPEARSALLEKYHHELEECSPRETWIGDAHQKSAPYPILGSEAHQRQLTELSQALVLAITDIVERWCSDVEARFPERMPIEPVEEQLLQVSRNLYHIYVLLNRPSGCNNRKRMCYLLSDSTKALGDQTFCWNPLMILRALRTIESVKSTLGSVCMDSSLLHLVNRPLLIWASRNTVSKELQTRKR